MTLRQTVLRDRLARHEAGRRQYRPNGGAFVTTHPHGLTGEMREELLDAMNYAAQIAGRWRVTVARWLTWLAAMLLTAEIRRMK